jgi:hypothetical protein
MDPVSAAVSESMNRKTRLPISDDEAQVQYKDDRRHSQDQGVTKRCLLSWLTNSSLVYESKCEGKGGVAGSQLKSIVSIAVHRSQNKLLRSNSIFNLWPGFLNNNLLLIKGEKTVNSTLALSNKDEFLILFDLHEKY